MDGGGAVAVPTTLTAARQWEDVCGDSPPLAFIQHLIICMSIIPFGKKLLKYKCETVNLTKCLLFLLGTIFSCGEVWWSRGSVPASGLHGPGSNLGLGPPHSMV